MHTGVGTLDYQVSDKGHRWVKLLIDHELIRYYRSTIWAYKDRVQPPMHRPHITVVNGHWEVIRPLHLKAWGRGQGQKYRFHYDGDVKFVGGVWFVMLRCEEMGDLREDLGLPRYFARRPLHFTLGKIVPSDEARERRAQRQERKRREIRKGWK